jgi:hypothetical protein
MGIVDTPAQECHVLTQPRGKLGRKAHLHRTAIGFLMIQGDLNSLPGLHPPASACTSLPVLVLVPLMQLLDPIRQDLIGLPDLQG